MNLGERSYPIWVGAGLIDDGDLLTPYVRGQRCCIVTNETVAPLYLERLRTLLRHTQVDCCVLPDGEVYKTLETYQTIVNHLIASRHDRTTTLVALGGGVVGDITGFAAATYMRGVAYVQVPTTLLAQVDSSVGGKTAVNHPSGKNLIGAFHQPKAVVADIGTLATLPEREFRAGLAEVVKYGVIRDSEFFDWLESNVQALLDKDVHALMHAVLRSCSLKADVVAADETEEGVRMILNFGHTFAHAIEALTRYEQFLHGEAVALGMALAADLSARSGWLDWAQARRLHALLGAFGLPNSGIGNLSANDVLDAMGLDKKVVDGRLRLVCARALGQVEVTDEMGRALIEQTLNSSTPCHG